MGDNTEFFKWTDQLSVGIQEIDNQHKKLVGLLNGLYQAFMNRQHVEVVGKIIDEMAAYAAYHFETEEKYFALFRYAESSAHIQEHLEFKQKVDEFILKFKKNNGALTYEVMNYLRKWLNNHIMISDKKYTGCFKENGLKS
ncbi:MAG: hemerythrin family protein [Prolixibacteraceae bacterium]|nr:hemerythrin family protein [Prolixibacteraceae bacterium]